MIGFEVGVHRAVISAQAEAQGCVTAARFAYWIPAFAGMTAKTVMPASVARVRSAMVGSKMKAHHTVIPAQAGIQSHVTDFGFRALGSGFRWNDGNRGSQWFMPSAHRPRC
ncbi:MAG: hypothetical protein NTW01_14530 [Gammaproteobacteria bacterium]|nr:hypothetical protein [Gammaproteobacteria bacterium]